MTTKTKQLSYLDQLSLLNNIGKKSDQSFDIQWKDIHFDPAENIRRNYGDLKRFDSLEFEQFQPIIGFMGEDGKFHPRDGWGRLLWMQDRLEQGFTLRPITIKLKADSATELGALDLMLNSATAKELTMPERGLGYQRYRDIEGLNNAQIALRVHKTPAHVGQCLDLVDNASPYALGVIEQGHIAATEVYKITATLDTDEADLLIKTVVDSAIASGKKATGKDIKAEKVKRTPKPKIADIPSQYFEVDETQERQSISQSLGNMTSEDWEAMDLGILRTIMSNLYG